MAPFQSMHLEILNKKYSPLAAIAIMDGKGNMKTYLPFELDEEVYSENSRTVVQKTALDTTASNGHGYEDVEDFIRDTLMDTLLNEIFESWWKVWIYAGVPLAKLMDFVANPQFSSLSRSKQMFHDWLLGHAGKNDYGLTDLIKALIRAECKSAAQFVVNHLQKCLNSGAFRNKPFGQWLEAQNLKLEHIGSVNDAAEPMSDVFLIDILQYFGVDCVFLGIACGLTKQERRDLSEPHPCGPQLQLFTLLCKVRQKERFSHEGLCVLLKALQQLDLNETKESIILLTKKWLDTKGESKQKDAKSFLDVIKQFTETSSLD
ncbi:uncharacterized protein LOC124140980 [Haliotis rufescens]|uniref:uncharacterized protein LOC124140980 n=1 Tax=Haliotis rufescens TaxID=6454 RepID=UPI00201E7C25|nr:uncharacterized protein LOC124140980 [Haliotis rufescens]